MPPRRKGKASTESVDNYLKAILLSADLRNGAYRVRLWLNVYKVAPASVTNMLQKLAKSLTPSVEYERHRGVLLSTAGKAAGA